MNYLTPIESTTINCDSCGHYITGGGCHKDSHTNFVKVDPESSCSSHVGKDAEGTINHKYDLHERRFDKDLPYNYLKLDYETRNDRLETFYRMVGTNL